MKPSFRALLAALLAAAFVAAPATASAIHTSYARFNIDYEVDRQDRAALVELWISRDDGATWRLFGYDPDLRSPVGFQAGEDGRYGFFVVVEDLAGNRENPAPGTAPQLSVVIDRAPPMVEVLSPAGGAFGRARGVEVAWRAVDEHLDNGPVTLDVSADDGQSWRTLAEGLPGSGLHLFRADQAREGERIFRFRISARDRAGNVGRAVSVDDVVLDTTPPSVRPAGPVRVRDGEVVLRYEADDPGGSGMESVLLYATSDGGASWAEVLRDHERSGLLAWKVRKPGEYSFYLAGTDRAGNASPPPAPGTSPQALATVEAAGPLVRLMSFNTGGHYRGGSEHDIVWSAEGDGLTARSVRLEFSTDGETWTEIARDLPPSGRHRWTLPGTDAERVRVRAVAVSSLGVSGKADSARTFSIDTTPPRARIRFDDRREALAPLAERERPKSPEQNENSEPGEPSEAGGKAEHAPPEPSAQARARNMLDAGDYEGAVSVMREYVSGEPWSVQANALLGEALVRQAQRHETEGGLAAEQILSRYDEAAAALRASIRGAESSGARLWLGTAHFQRARLFLRRSGGSDDGVAEARLAVEEFERALKLPPNSGEEYYYAGMAHYILAATSRGAARSEHSGRAEELLSSSLLPTHGSLAGPVAGSAHWYLAELAEMKRGNIKAIEHWQRALAAFGDGSEYAAQIRERIRRLGGR